MIKPIQSNVSTPSFKGFVNLSDRNEMINTRYIKSVEKSAFGGFTKINMFDDEPQNSYLGKKINYVINNDYETVSKAVAEADKKGDLIDLKG